MKAPKLYVLVDPDGHPVPGAIATNESAVWAYSFHIVAETMGSDWQFKYHDVWNEAQKSAFASGWSIQPCTITLLPKP